MSQAVRKTYLIKAKDFKSFENIQYATKSNLSATLDVKSPVLSAYKYFRVSPNTMGKERYFNPTLQRYQTGKGGRAARVKVMKSGGLKSITVNAGSGDLKGFIAEMKNKHVGVFQRTEGKKRGEKGEIKEILALSAANMVYNKKAGAFDEKLQGDMQKYLLKQINRQIERVLKK